MRRTIYDEIGGEPAVTAVVNALYERLLADPDLLAYFAGRDLARLKAHQRALVTVALGGGDRGVHRPDDAAGPRRHGHPHEAFDKVLDHLEAVLLRAGVAPVGAAKFLAILQPLRGDVMQSMAVAR